MLCDRRGHLVIITKIVVGMYVCRDMYYNDVHQYGICFTDVETLQPDPNDPNGYNVLTCDALCGLYPCQEHRQYGVAKIVHLGCMSGVILHSCLRNPKKSSNRLLCRQD